MSTPFKTWGIWYRQQSIPGQSSGTLYEIKQYLEHHTDISQCNIKLGAIRCWAIDLWLKLPANVLPRFTNDVICSSFLTVGRVVPETNEALKTSHNPGVCALTTGRCSLCCKLAHLRQRTFLYAGLQLPLTGMTWMAYAVVKQPSWSVSISWLKWQPFWVQTTSRLGSGGVASLLVTF